MKDSQFYQIMMMLWLILGVIATIPFTVVVSLVMMVLNAVLALRANNKEKKQ